MKPSGGEKLLLADLPDERRPAIDAGQEDVGRRVLGAPVVGCHDLGSGGVGGNEAGAGAGQLRPHDRQMNRLTAG